MLYQYEDSILNYDVIGKGKPIVIIHGFGGNMAYMKACMEPVFKKCHGYQRIYIDLPGMGKSKFNIKYASSDSILDIIVSFIKEHINQPFLVVGQSYGGYIARGVLSYFGKQVDGMMLLCPVVHPENRNVENACIKYADEEFLSKLNADDKDAYLEYAVVINETTYQRFHQSAHSALQEANQEFLMTLKNHYTCSFDIDEKIKKLCYDKPVLFITAHQDICVGYKDLWNLIDDYPKASFYMVDKAGHNMQTEQPDIFEALVKQWLQNIN